VVCPLTGCRSTALALPPGQTQFFSGWLERALRLAASTELQHARHSTEAPAWAFQVHPQAGMEKRPVDQRIEREMFVEEQIDELAQLLF
jgi:hypothetical protein